MCEGVSNWQVRFRHMAVVSTGFLLRKSLVDEQNGLDGSERYLNDGYGLIVLMNHFSLRDAPQVANILFNRPTIRQRPVLGPIAWHQYKPIFQFFADLLGLQAQRIVTERTVQLLGEKVKLGDGMAEYLQSAIVCLRKGGIVLVAPQGGRQPALGQPTGRPLGSLLAQAKRCGFDRIALMFVGLGIRGATDYALDQVGGTNFDKVYEIRLGKTLPADVVTNLAGGRRKVDAWVFGYLRQLVPSAYGGTMGETEYLEDVQLAKQH